MNMDAVRTVFVFVQVLGLFSICFAQNDSCQTPRNEPGECKTLDQCEPLYSIVKKRPIKSEDADYLHRSQCGFEGRMPKVCCASKGSGAILKANEDQHQPLNVSLLPTTEECGTSRLFDQILGGDLTDIREFPWMALLEYDMGNGKSDFFCGGVLISKRYVLTAAHCIKGKLIPPSYKVISIRLGEYNLGTERDCFPNGNTKICSDPPQNIPTEDIIVHENYNKFDINRYNDIAIIRLVSEAQKSTFVEPICLPTTEYDRKMSYVEQKMQIAGWGQTETKDRSPIKLKLTVPIKSQASCSNTYALGAVKLSDKQLCAGGQPKKDSCAGDSGGPLMNLTTDKTGELVWYAVGILSFGPSPCGVSGWPGIYTKVVDYMPWITSKLKP